MATGLFPFPLYSGNTYPLPLSFTNKDGTPKDLTGITVGCTVKDDPTDPDSEAVYQQDIAGDATGKVQFGIGPFEAGEYFLDVVWWNSTQANWRQTVIGTTRLAIHQSVTSRLIPANA